MTVFYLFNEQGVCCGTTTDEDYASEWADANEGYYCCDQPSTLFQEYGIIIIEREIEKMNEEMIRADEREKVVNEILKAIESEYDLNYGEILINPRDFWDLVEGYR